MAVTKEEIVETLKGMTAIELSELVHELEDVFGVSAAPVAVAAVAGAGADAGAGHRHPERAGGRGDLPAPAGGG